MEHILPSAAAIIAEISVLIGAVIPVFVWIKKIIVAQRCQLRNEMLNIYYKNLPNAQIRQYEYQNFMMMYDAYKALKGNSFIDRVHDDIKKWQITQR